MSKMISYAQISSLDQKLFAVINNLTILNLMHVASAHARRL